MSLHLRACICVKAKGQLVSGLLPYRPQLSDLGGQAWWTLLIEPSHWPQNVTSYLAPVTENVCVMSGLRHWVSGE